MEVICQRRRGQEVAKNQVEVTIDNQVVDVNVVYDNKSNIVEVQIPETRVTEEAK